MIELKEFDELIKFNSEDEQLLKLKQWSILSDSAKELKKLIYRGASANTSVECEVIGYIEKFTNSKCINMSYETAVIKVGEHLYKINPMYLKDMQESDVKIKDLEFFHTLLSKNDCSYLESYFHNKSEYNIISISLKLSLPGTNDIILLTNNTITYRNGISSKFSVPIPLNIKVDDIVVIEYEFQYESGNVICNTIYNPKSKRYTIY